MSAGRFTDGHYEANDGIIHPIRVQPETTQAVLSGVNNIFADPDQAGVTKSKISAKVSKGAREIGLGPRKVTISYGDTAESYPDGYAVGTVLEIPVFVKATWDGLTKGDTATYLGKIGTIGFPLAESTR